MVNFLALIKKAYAVSPRWLQRMAVDAAPHTDIFFWMMGMLPLVTRYGDPPAKPNWVRVSVAIFLFVCILILLAYLFSLMAVYQLYSYRAFYNIHAPMPIPSYIRIPDKSGTLSDDQLIAKRKAEEAEAAAKLAAETAGLPEFAANLPLDLVFGFSPANVTDFYGSLGTGGTEVYLYYLVADSAAILCYTYAHYEILGYLYPAGDPSSFLTSRAAWLLGGLDLYENVGHFFMAQYAMQISQTSSLEEVFAAREAGEPGPYAAVPDALGKTWYARVTSANSMKFLLLFVVLGLEVSGFVKKFAGQVEQEVKETGVSVAGTEAQKKAQEKKKARLAKKTQ
ncbi:hypothetical protein DFJ73DRAFT_847787 [Zopfochytrium polystomum]|nr:hypothetical protein DFJ73DRAFT_847787 [Zopfochytrium polystomum]